jgi:hypothetical protein
MRDLYKDEELRAYWVQSGQNEARYEAKKGLKRGSRRPPKSLWKLSRAQGVCQICEREKDGLAVSDGMLLCEPCEGAYRAVQ